MSNLQGQQESTATTPERTFHVPVPVEHSETLRVPDVAPEDWDPSVAFSVTVLGSGTSQGVPMIACDCKVCLSTDPRDKRTRSSIYVASPTTRLLVDTTPELRLQGCREGLKRVDAVLFTHEHADHIMGFDDLRRFCEMAAAPMPVYSRQQTLDALYRCFPWAFTVAPEFFTYVNVKPYLIQPLRPFVLGDIRITAVELPHGKSGSLGFIFERADIPNGPRMAYMSDCKAVPEAANAAAFGAEVLIVDGLREKPHPTHMSVAEALQAGQTMQARHIYLTHLTHDKSHEQLISELPANASPAFDGMKVELRRAPVHP